MNSNDYFFLGKPKDAARPAWRLWLMNSGLFFATLAVTIAAGTLLKSSLGNSAGKSGGAYYLQATSALKPGDVIGPDVAVWRSAYGKRGGDWIADAAKTSTAYWGWRVVAPIAAGKPIPRSAAIEGAATASSLPLPPNTVGFVLSGEDLAGSADMLKVGDRVSVIAVIDEAASAAVSTVVANALVVHVRPALKRNGKGLDTAVTIAVSPETAEDLAVWRRAGSLDVTLATSTATPDMPASEWRQVFEVEAADDTASVIVDDPSSASEEILQGGPADPAAARRKVTVVTPAGAQERDIP